MTADAGPSDPSRPGTVSLRLITFGTQGTWHDVDRTLRDWLAAYAVAPGNQGTWFGRRGAGPTDERIVVSVWEPGRAPGAEGDIAERLSREVPPDVHLAGPSSEVLPVRIHETFPRATPMTILRVFRGRTRPGELEAYLAEAAEGTRLDGERPDGPGSLVCAADGEIGFVTVSLWPDWAAIEACTGGDIRRPLATRNAARLESGAPVHFELVTMTDADPAAGVVDRPARS